MQSRLIHTHLALPRVIGNHRRTFMVQFEARVEYEQSANARTLTAKAVVESYENLTEPDQSIEATPAELAIACARAVNQVIKDEFAPIVAEAPKRIVPGPLFAQLVGAMLFGGLILRTLHLVRPDLIPYPIDAPSFC